MGCCLLLIWKYDVSNSPFHFSHINLSYFEMIVVLNNYFIFWTIILILSLVNQAIHELFWRSSKKLSKDFYLIPPLVKKKVIRLWGGSNQVRNRNPLTLATHKLSKFFEPISIIILVKCSSTLPWRQ